MILNPCLLGAWQCNTDMLRSQGVFHLFLGRGASRGLQLRHAFLLHPSHKRSFSSSAEEYLTLRAAKEKEIQNLAEVREDVAFEELLRTSSLPAADAFPLGTGRAHTMTRDQVMRVLEAGFVTSLLHCESRVAALLGEGFYTIGPGGEELLAAAGVPIQEQDLTALHYRHVGTQIARHLGMGIGVDEIIMNRARAHTVSSADIVTGGAHCSLGGTPRDFLVTSTLSSQCTPAVGRALGIGLSHGLKNLQPDVDAQFAVDAVSYVSLGDGSTHNAHFLSAVNLTDYARNRGYKCPVVFGISDNDLSISLRGHGWVKRSLKTKLEASMQVFMCNGNDMYSIYESMASALEYARVHKRSCAIIFSDLARRFGHAATDRQAAYRSEEEIAGSQQHNPLAVASAMALRDGFTTYDELSALYVQLRETTVNSFAAASAEPKISSRAQLLDRLSQPLATPQQETSLIVSSGYHTENSTKGQRDVMRKHMSRVFDEQMELDKAMVYLGEDVEHGGYYLVTDSYNPKDPRKLRDKHPHRVRDFPPDETALLGVGIGYSQAGLLPIVEIPYAKYLDCGADIFWEAAIQNWLSNGKAPIGMLIRLQGFGNGVFGGNYHTHNSLSMPPGIDVVCYSNGSDYVRGMRFALQQAAAGRVVMTVDSTNLLNMRHVVGLDDAWKTAYPADVSDMLTFDHVIMHNDGGEGESACDTLVVTYGNGVVTSVQARHSLGETHDGSTTTFDIVDCPLLSEVPQGLIDLLEAGRGQYRSILFVDVCKQGQNPLAGHASMLQNRGLLDGVQWRMVTSQRTYNPLGSMITFVSQEDVIEAYHELN